MQHAAADSTFQHKLSAAVRARVLAGKSGRIAVLIRTDGAPGVAERRALGDAGIEVVGVSGDIVAARLSTDALGRLTALKFVRYVELDKALAPAPEDTP